MRISKRLLFILVPVLLLLAAGTAAFAAGELPFTDIDGHWAEQSIVNMYDRGIVTGHADGTFGPDENLTRGQMATMLDRQGWCPDCHNDTTMLTGKLYAWEASLHGSGEVFLEDGGEAGCAGCHSGGGFSAMIAAGKSPNQVTEGDPNPTKQDCRACHQIHVTKTAADWKLETVAPVALFATPGKTYDGGAGNLCANCHQVRRVFPADATANVTVTARFGPHHGPQSAMLLGIAGAGPAAVGAPMFHYTAVADTCITCHMGPITDPDAADDEDDAGEADERPMAGHTMLPSPANCTSCHAGAEDFDIGGTQTEVQAMLDELKAKLVAAGLLNAEGGIVAGSYPKAQAEALWNWIYVNNEDKSLGVHNPTYTKALLQSGIDAM